MLDLVVTFLSESSLFCILLASFPGFGGTFMAVSSYFLVLLSLLYYGPDPERSESQETCPKPGS